MAVGKPKTKRIRGRKLQEIRRRAYAEDPTCARCHRVLLSDGWQSDHKVALANGGDESPENRQLLCDDCHQVKTAEDFGHKRKPLIGEDGWPIEDAPGEKPTG